MKALKFSQFAARLAGVALASVALTLTLVGVTPALATIMYTSPGDQLPVEGLSSSINLGSFSDSQSSSLGWTVHTDFGDGTPTQAFTVFAQGSLGLLSHTYGEEGGYIVSVTIANNVTGSTSGPATFDAITVDPKVIGAGVNISGIQNMQITTDVAMFTDPGGAEPNSFDPTGTAANHYSATINWGDGSPTSIGTIGGSFDVYGTHTYTTFGKFTITTDINHEDMITNTTSTAAIAPAPAPEPATLALIGLGLAGLGFSRRARKQ